MFNLLHACLPDDNCRQSSAWKVADRVLGEHPEWINVLDLGCGRGESREYMLERNPSLRWIGLDLAHSPEVDARETVEGEFHSYDGIHIPFEDRRFDFVFSRQAFEHVQRPHDLLTHVARVLRPGGIFAGSTSQLEPYHSYSTFGYTPYGWRYLVEEVAGLRLLEIRPGTDAFTVVARRALGVAWMDRWFERESPVNRLITIAGRARRRTNLRINCMKLRFAGVFTFIATKPESAELQ